MCAANEHHFGETRPLTILRLTSKLLDVASTIIYHILYGDVGFVLYADWE